MSVIVVVFDAQQPRVRRTRLCSIRKVSTPPLSSILNRPGSALRKQRADDVEYGVRFNDISRPDL